MKIIKNILILMYNDNNIKNLNYGIKEFKDDIKLTYKIEEINKDMVII